MEHESDGDTKYNRCAWYSHQKIDKGAGGLGNKRTKGDHPNDIKIGQNTNERSGNFRRLAVTQTPVENHQLTLG